VSPLKPALLQGTLDMLILKALAVEPMHGWGIGERLEAMSGDVFRVPQGSLYPAVVRLQKYGWIRSTWRTTENNRRARYYALTPSGQRQLEAEREQWREAATAVDRILSFAS
jgi:PadR family transcriptional regulator PadR